MDMNTYEQIPVDSSTLGPEADYLTENQDVILAFVDDEVISVDLPPHVNLKVVHTEPGLKGDTATNVLKPATVESGATVQVPLFIDEDDMIRIDTRTGEYVERVKD
jgi:elongation factor P